MMMMIMMIIAMRGASKAAGRPQSGTPRMRCAPLYESFWGSSINVRFKKICVLASSNWGPLTVVIALSSIHGIPYPTGGEGLDLGTGGPWGASPYACLKFVTTVLCAFCPLWKAGNTNILLLLRHSMQSIHRLNQQNLFVGGPRRREQSESSEKEDPTERRRPGVRAEAVWEVDKNIYIYIYRERERLIDR